MGPLVHESDENKGGAGGFACAFPVKSKGWRNRLPLPFHNLQCVGVVDRAAGLNFDGDDHGAIRGGGDGLYGIKISHILPYTVLVAFVLAGRRRVVSEAVKAIPDGVRVPSGD